MTFELGETKSGYKFLEVLKRSNYSVEYRVLNTFAQRQETMNLLSQRAADDVEGAERFLREMRVRAQLIHPNIVTLFSAMEVDGHLAMTTESVEGPTLAQQLRSGALPWRQAVRLARQALAALEFAHLQHVVHRDITPENIVIGPGGVLKLMNFSLAKSERSPKLTQVGSVIGNLKYISPEQVKGVTEADSRSDLYSLGVVIFEMVCGRPPFESESQFELMVAHVNQEVPRPSEWNLTLPKEIEAVILKALAKDSAHRYQTASEFDEALVEAVAVVDRPRPVAEPAAVVVIPTPAASPAVAVIDSPRPVAEPAAVVVIPTPAESATVAVIDRPRPVAEPAAVMVIPTPAESATVAVTSASEPVSAPEPIAEPEVEPVVAVAAVAVSDPTTAPPLEPAPVPVAEAVAAPVAEPVPVLVEAGPAAPTAVRKEASDAADAAVSDMNPSELLAELEALFAKSEPAPVARETHPAPLAPEQPAVMERSREFEAAPVETAAAGVAVMDCPSVIAEPAVPAAGMAPIPMIDAVARDARPATVAPEQPAAIAPPRMLPPQMPAPVPSFLLTNPVTAKTNWLLYSAAAAVAVALLVVWFVIH